MAARGEGWGRVKSFCGLEAHDFLAATVTWRDLKTVRSELGDVCFCLHAFPSLLNAHFSRYCGPSGSNMRRTIALCSVTMQTVKARQRARNCSTNQSTALLDSAGFSQSSTAIIGRSELGMILFTMFAVFQLERRSDRLYVYYIFYLFFCKC